MGLALYIRICEQAQLRLRWDRNRAETLIFSDGAPPIIPAGGSAAWAGRLTRILMTRCIIKEAHLIAKMAGRFTKARRYNAATPKAHGHSLSSDCVSRIGERNTSLHRAIPEPPRPRSTRRGLFLSLVARARAALCVGRRRPTIPSSARPFRCPKRKPYPPFPISSKLTEPGPTSTTALQRFTPPSPPPRSHAQRPWSTASPVRPRNPGIQRSTRSQPQLL